ncbi:GntR family transcriptional regulator [Leifsonia sp. PS1209]|uniref:GntR family transcriptional regulator n=1 Tax=Leifsonia sp. PS1209 TaxID=2724914 RepID=UPI001442C069|nr:GntR family transcriptional regulator [Leifsonia sp. PS1209]QIZ98413.1 GntR family transcriptional regulator [Leifsonia sp. PS1209]
MPQQSESPRTIASQDIAADLRRRIQSGEFVAGMRLPSEASLAEEYRVTRSLVRGAMAKLARQSLVLARPRDGWMVQARHHTQVFDRMLSFAQWAEAGGRVAGGLISERVRRGADAREAQQLGVRPGERILCFTRVRTLDGLVVMVERSAWAPWVADVVDAMPDDVASTTAALALEGIRVTSGSHRIEAVAASTQDAALLRVRRSSPLLQVSRTTATRDGRVVELGVDRYLAGTIAFDVNAGESTRAVV